LNKFKYPFIIKGRTGAGGSEIAIIKNAIDFEYFKTKISNYILQEYLEGDEYTCGIFRKKNGEVKTIAFRRQLSSNNGGYTLYGEVVQNSVIDRLLLNISEKINLNGSINVQLRLSNSNIPYVFEINPRFSSTVLFRHLIGYEDLIWAIKEYFNIETNIDIKIKFGVKFYKGYNEYIEKITENGTINFSEYINPITNQFGGMNDLCFSVAGYLFLETAVNNPLAIKTLL
jgi:carbamoyl-phosphate synthase large subunit